jgi:acyl-CoA reductase-like NAD-dependent aldehyde dehydrogenase
MNETTAKIAVRHEPMRIAGRKVDADDVIEVRYPYTDAVIGTVPAGNAEHAREAFEVAAAYKPSFTRYERQQILFRAAELIRQKRDWLAQWLTLELGICH